MIQFKRTKPSIWLGNGFGYSYAEYTIIRNGVDLQVKIYNLGYRWNARIGDKFWYADKLKDLKEKLIKDLST